MRGRFGGSDSGLEAEHCQGQVRFCADQPKGFRDVGTAEISEEADCEVPERSQDAWSIAGSYL